MGTKFIDRLIINSPYEKPKQHWRYERETQTWELVEGRRKAGYIIATPGSRSFDDPGIFVELPLVNRIRERVDEWREIGYPGVTGVTRRLLEHWQDPEERKEHRFFFCQLEAIETLIWLAETPDSEKVGLDISGGGGPFRRLCAKMATGTGKTVVMAMLIAWHVLNKVAYPQDPRFSKNVLVVAPGLTVKRRLQVLVPGSESNYYDEFNIIPPGLMDALRQGRVLVRNWHALDWETEEEIAKKRSVDKRGPKSDEAYVRDVLGEMASARRLVVINDEAHHAWRMPAESKVRGLRKEEVEQATKWVGGLDRIHRAREILCAYDFSATPFAPTGKASSEEALFGWIVSDFGLNDAIESGLVKTPRVVIRDDALPDAKTYRSRLYHIYADPEVKDDLNRRAGESEALPDLVVNAYLLLAADWVTAKQAWAQEGHPTPPVMITVANRTETAARVRYALEHRRIDVPELSDPATTLHIDSQVLEKAEEREDAPENGALAANEDAEEDGAPTDDEAEQNGQAKAKGSGKLTKQEWAERLRQMVNTVGQPGKPGAHVHHVISVGMLSEGWDAKTVTHIMGLRAFTSQLLCEQVVGRGLRRISYDVNPETGLFEPEYVNVFGVPFTFLPHEGGEGTPPHPPKAATRIEPLPEKKSYEIVFPNIIRVERTYRPQLVLDESRIQPLVLDAMETVTSADLAPILEGKPNPLELSQIELERIAKRWRMQTILFRTAVNVYDQLRPAWEGSREILLAQVVGLVERFLRSGRIVFRPANLAQDDLRRRVTLMVHLNKVVQHVFAAIQAQNAEKLEPVFDDVHPIRSTADMRPWNTTRPCARTERSHISHCVYDSTWEASEAYELDRNPLVAAWVKNDHLGFVIRYLFNGVQRRYHPDFLVKLVNGTMLVLEVKGQDAEENRAKWAALEEWVQGVNAHGGFGKWAWDVSWSPGDLRDILTRHAAEHAVAPGRVA